MEEGEIFAMWQEFEVKADALIVRGYSLPHPLQVKAVNKLDSQVLSWREKLDTMVTNDVVKELHVSSHGDVILSSCDDRDDDDVGTTRITESDVESHENNQGWTEEPVAISCSCSSPSYKSQVEEHVHTGVILKAIKSEILEPKRPSNTVGTMLEQTTQNDDDYIGDFVDNDFSEDKTDLIRSSGDHSEDSLSDDKETCDTDFNVSQIDSTPVFGGKSVRKRTRKSSRKPCKDKIRKERCCEICKKVFMDARNYNNHIAIHKNGPLECDMCDKTFKTAGGLSLHKKTHNPTHQCSECDYVAPIMSYLKRHMDRVHYKHDTSRKPHACPHCSARFFQHSHLLVHLTSHDKGNKIYQCSQCSHSTHSQYLLNTHVNFQHTKRDQYICNICGYVTKYKTSLEQHQRRHNDDKIYKCSLCDFRCVDLPGLRRHERRHKNLLNHKCHICGKAFAEAANLKRHLIVHTGQKDFSCDFCPYACNVSTNLRKHMINVHHINLPKNQGGMSISRMGEVSPKGGNSGVENILNVS